MKGISQLIAAVLLILIAVAGSFVVFMWSQETTKNYQNQSEEWVQGRTKSSEANFYIKEKNGDNITIINNGRVKLPVKSFTFYFNDQKILAQPYKNVSKLAPDEELTFKMVSIS